MALMRRPTRTRLTCAVLITAVAATAPVACGDEGDAPSAEQPTTVPSSEAPPASSTIPAETVPTQTTAPATFREAFSAQLGADLGDVALATKIVDGLDDAVVAQLAAAVSGDVGDPLLSFTPSTVAAGEVDALVVFAFGNRTDDQGDLVPGPTNEALAATVSAFVAEHPVPVFAQWEVAEILIAGGVPAVTSIDPEIDADGKLVYLSTEGVAEKAVELAAGEGSELGQVGVIAFQDHAVRSVMTAQGSGMTAAVPAGTELPSDYDPDSTQPWTRDRATFVSTDLAGRLLMDS